MKNLISMVDFVLEQSREIVNDKRFGETCVMYANFLNQPLALWMFIPCDEEGNILIKPQFSAWELVSPAVDTDTPIKEYTQAKERVLFDGWMLKEKFNSRIPTEELVYPLKGYSDVKLPVYFSDGFAYIPCNDSADRIVNKTIQDLLDYHCRNYLNMSDTALKQTGLL